MSRLSTKNKKYALRKIGKVFGSCVVATVITLGGAAIMAPSVTVYASTNISGGGPENIEDLSSSDSGYEVIIPKGKKYIRNDESDNQTPKLIDPGYNGRSFILPKEGEDDYFLEHPMSKLFTELYDKDEDGTVNDEYKDPKYPHVVDSGLTGDEQNKPGVWKYNPDGKYKASDGQIDDQDTIVIARKPITVDENADENVVKEDGSVVLSSNYRIHVNEGDHIDKKDDVYEVGTKPKEKVETTPKTTRYVGDPDTPYNTKVTSVDGHDGSVTKKTTYDLDEHTGEVTPKETVTTVEKEDKVVKVGNKEVTTEKIDITPHYTADPRLEKDRQETDNNGTEGTREITKVYEVSPTTGDLSNPTRTENVTVAMVPKEVRVGNVEKEVVETEITTRYIPDETKTRDEQKVVTPGSKGVHTKTTTYSVDPNTGETHTPVVTENDTPMEQKVVKVGIKPVEKTEIIDITTKYIQDPDLDYGQTVIVNPGSEGKIVTTTTYTLNEQDGTTTENQPTVQKTEMVQKVVRVGVKPKVEENPIPYTTRYVEDNTKDKDYRETTQAGVKGKETTTTTYTMDPNTGTVTENKPTTDTEQPTEEIITVGTKPKVDVTPVPSPKRYEKDPEREKGQPNQEIPGKPGMSTTTTTYEVDPKTGKVTEKVGDPVVVEPTETVVKVPAKDKVVTEEIPVVTEYVDDPTLEPGKEKEVTPGQPGEKTTTTTYTVDGKTGDITEKTTTQITKEMVKRMVKRGPKEGTPSQPEQPTAPEEAPAQPGQPSEPEDQPNLKVAPPTIAIVEEANKASIEVKAPKKDADTVKITYPKSDGSGNEVLTLTKQPSGEWTLDKQPENVTLDKKTGTVTIPRESVVNKEKVQAQAKHKTSGYTPFVYAALSIEEATPEYPITLWVDTAGNEIKKKVEGQKVQAGEIAGYKWLSSRLEEGILTHTFEKVANGTPSSPESSTSHPRTPSSSPSTSTPEKPNKAETPAVRTVWRDENGKDLKVPSVDKQEAGEVPGYEFVESHREGDNLTVHVFRTKQAQTPAPKDQTPSPEQAASPAPSKVSEQRGEAVATATSEKTVDSAASTKTSDKAELPNTGTEANATLASAGIMTLLAGLGLGFFKKKED
ncbi:G5 domain-containing protein [Streptococcus pneumoniae]|uniref:G5 domain-containing protein n=1 Tax=Streptococcus pseudopneumoniae TaxID=257758 RepID=UPI0031234DE1